MILLIVVLILFYFYIDCDFVTLFYHLYHTRYVNKNDGYYGKTIWIVGASSGIGEHLVYQCVRNLASCVIISARREKELERVKAECANIDANCAIIIKPLDLLEFADDSQSAMRFLESEILNDPNIKDCNILVVNSGITQRGLGIETDLSVIKKLVNVNVLGVVSLIQSFVQTFGKPDSKYSKRHPKGKINQMKQIGSLLASKSESTHSIFVTSSLAGKIGAPGQSAYALTKHAINGFLEGIKAELVSYNIHIGIVCPGPIALTASSLGGLGATLSQESGRLDKSAEKKRGSKMKIERLAQLYTTAIMYNLSESWISNNPQLLFVYIKQYLPAITPVLFKIIGPMYMKKLLASRSKQESAKKNEPTK